MLMLERGSGDGGGSEATYADLAFSIPSAICLQGELFKIITVSSTLFTCNLWITILSLIRTCTRNVMKSSCFTSWPLREVTNLATKCLLSSIDCLFRSSRSFFIAALWRFSAFLLSSMATNTRPSVFRPYKKIIKFWMQNLSLGSL